jgi:hypothetical protein
MPTLLIAAQRSNDSPVFRELYLFRKTLLAANIVGCLFLICRSDLSAPENIAVVLRIFDDPYTYPRLRFDVHLTPRGESGFIGTEGSVSDNR